MAKKHYPITILGPCVNAIVEQDAIILNKIKDHALKGEWQGYREFHPARYEAGRHSYDGWIVVYRIDKNVLVLTLVATGNHDLFNR
ncbi:hypothetical protein IV38_GL001646 [Lactobacillus selangorensis]|uniref:Addiction module toxin RelE n=1 Tax=Lactobacillus selangorensis TaxID=81857 RepID=A0A0R2FHT2_9LACO|nr:type II toxin-antitoxin system mRNA interferase toxin, RelE/StbE family [Lactobacillus selangorensis]KRN28193.1 hypothetical protein IV38_GL001646 [Lactobacillus selangorensis]KRN30931.1 hypothetical protein IV40_GL001569 [Lactobacillus selangorensis]